MGVLGILKWKLRQKNGARDGTRTRDNHVGNVELYQLSYSRSKITRNRSLWKEKI